jgi:hypothetical protein
VRELVGHHRERLVARHVADQVVVEDHAAAVGEPGHVGVEGRRPSGCVSDQDLVHGDPLSLGELEDAGPQVAVGQRGEVVEQRLHHQRVGEAACDDQTRRESSDHGRPGPSPPAGTTDDHQREQARHHDVQRLGDHQVPGEAGPCLVGEPGGPDVPA